MIYSSDFWQNMGIIEGSLIVNDSEGGLKALGKVIDEIKREQQRTDADWREMQGLSEILLRGDSPGCAHNDSEKRTEREASG